MKPKHELYTVSVDFSEGGDDPTIVIMYRDSDKPGARVRHVRTLRGKHAIKFHDEYLLSDQEKLESIMNDLIRFGVSEEVAMVTIYGVLGTEKLAKEDTDDD